MLEEYVSQTQRMVHDANQRLINPHDIIRYVNLARREVAMRAQCIRRLTPVSGSIISGDIINGGHDYINPTVVISPPDFPSGTLPFPNGLQAVATVEPLGGVIDTFNVQVGGFGYFNPSITIEDPTGHGAVVVANLSGFNKVSQGQEVYPFSAVDLSMWPGVRAIFMVRSISIIFSNYRYSLPCYGFSTYQAMVRNYPFQFQDVPAVCGQYGQGTDGSLYMYPLPSQTYQMEWDAFCLPDNLAFDADFEAIPEPWTDAVPHFAAYLAFLELQNANSARLHQALFNEFVTRYSTYTRPGRAINPYGRP